MEQRYCMKCMRPTGGTQMCPYCGHVAGETTLAAHVLRPGTILDGRYILGEPLGQGGFGITYIGRDRNLDIRVAIKEYFPSGYAIRNVETSDSITITDERLRLDIQKGKDSFLKEARTLAQFKGTPGIVDVLNFFEANDTAYIVMEYLDGETLAHRLKRELFTADEIFRLMEPVFDTLEKIHQQGVVHRDISPDNIMMLPDGRLKLMDFGAARLMNYSDQRSVSVVLKAGYAPLEQYSTKGEQGPWTDIYALCATIYKSITKITPPDAHDRLMGEEIRWPSELGIPIPIRQEAVLKKGMEIRQKDRIQSIGELQAALREETSGSAEFGPITWKPLPEDATVALPKEQSVLPMKQEPNKEATSKTTSDTGLPHNERKAEAKQPGNKKKPAIWAVCATLVLAAAALGIVLLTGRDKQKPTEETVSTQTETHTQTMAQHTLDTSPTSVPFTMPDLTGMDLETAGNVLSAYGLAQGEITYALDDVLESGQIISHVPAAGEEAKRGNTVSFVIAEKEMALFRKDQSFFDYPFYSIYSTYGGENYFCALLDNEGEVWYWNRLSKSHTSPSGIKGIKALVQADTYNLKNNMVMITTDGRLLSVELSTDNDGLMNLTDKIVDLDCPSKVVYAVDGKDKLFALGEDGKVYEYNCSIYDSKYYYNGYISDFPPIETLQCICYFTNATESGAGINLLARAKDGTFYGWGDVNVYGHFLASSSSFQPRKACKLDIDPSYQTVQMFREVGKEKIMLACLDTNNTVTIINNKKTVEMVVEQCEYFSTGFTCAWFITADGMAKSYGADPGNNNLPHLRDNGKIRMVCTAGWDTIVVYQDDSFTLAGQKWDSDPHIYLKREDPSLLNPVEKVVFDSWSVIGSICGTMWDTDFSMTEVEPGVWKSDPLELKAEDQLKVRANNDWTNNYGLDGDHSLIQINEKHGIVQDGLNIIIETDGVYVVILDFNTNTIAITE